MTVNPKRRKSAGNQLIFIASHPFSDCLFFLKCPVWNVNVAASSWTRHSWVTVLSCHCEGRHGVLMQTNVSTFPLETFWWLLLWQTKYFRVPEAFYHCTTLTDASSDLQTTNIFLHFRACALWSLQRFLQLLSVSLTETNDWLVHLFHFLNLTCTNIMCLCWNHDAWPQWKALRLKDWSSYISHKVNMWNSF